MELIPKLLSVAIMIYFAWRFIHGYSNPSLYFGFDDKFEIGYIEETEETIVYAPKFTPKPIPKETKPKPIPTPIIPPKPPEPIVDKELYNDCVDALVALGVKAGVAKKEVSKFFSKNQADSLEDFITQFYKKGKHA